MGSWGHPTCVFASMQAAMPLKQAWQPACLQIHMRDVPRSPWEASFISHLKIDDEKCKMNVILG